MRLIIWLLLACPVFSQSSGSASGAPEPALQWVIPSDHPDLKVILRLDGLPDLLPLRVLERRRRTGSHERATVGGSCSRHRRSQTASREVLRPGPGGTDLELSMPHQTDPVRGARQEVSPRLAKRLTQAALALKYGASFFLALYTRHCTVPIGMARAAAIS
jgi:hypothetical protein